MLVQDLLQLLGHLDFCLVELEDAVNVHVLTFAYPYSLSHSMTEGEYTSFLGDAISIEYKIMHLLLR